LFRHGQEFKESTTSFFDSSSSFFLIFSPSINFTFTVAQINFQANKTMHLLLLSSVLATTAIGTSILSARSDAYNITTDQLLTISPNASTCDNPPAAGECATAEQAAPAISASFSAYSVDSRAEQAALVSLMAFETADFKYNRNHFPGVAGQGSTFPPYTS
jgi:hypothetical protein